MDYRLSATGFRELTAQLRDFQARATNRGVLQEAMLEAVEPIVAEAQRIAKKDIPEIGPSVRSGLPEQNLTKHMQRRVAKDTLVVVGATARDARFLEFGTYKDEAQPFLRPAVTKFTNSGAVFHRFAAALGRRLGL